MIPVEIGGKGRQTSAGDYDLSDTRRSGRSVKFDDDVLKSLVEPDPRLSVQELRRSL